MCIRDRSSPSFTSFIEPSSKTSLQLTMYSHSNFPLVPWVPVAKAPPIVIVLISGKQGMHHPLASTASIRSFNKIPDWTVMVRLSSL